MDTFMSDTLLVRDAEGLAALRDGWERLAARCAPMPMQGYAWSAACAATVDAGEVPHVLVVGGPEQPEAIAPLVRRGPHLELLGAGRLFEPSDLLYSGEAPLAALTRAIAALRMPVLLSRLPADAPTIEALSKAFAPLGVVVARQAAQHATVVLDEGWTAPEGRLSSRRASDLRRARRRALKQGEVETELLVPAPPELPSLLADALAIEARSWKGRAGTALSADQQRAAFFRAYLTEAARAGRLRVSFLRVDGRRVAMQLAVEWRERLWLLKIGHDESLARCSPGTLLMLEVIRDAAARGLRAVQMLGEVEDWTSMWTQRLEYCMTLVAYPPRPSSLAVAVSDAAGVARRRRAARRTA